jgi:hypothetical protein
MTDLLTYTHPNTEETTKCYPDPVGTEIVLVCRDCGKEI